MAFTSTNDIRAAVARRAWKFASFWEGILLAWDNDLSPEPVHVPMVSNSRTGDALRSTIYQPFVISSRSNRRLACHTMNVTVHCVEPALYLTVIVARQSNSNDLRANTLASLLLDKDCAMWYGNVLILARRYKDGPPRAMPRKGHDLEAILYATRGAMRDKFSGHFNELRTDIGTCGHYRKLVWRHYNYSLPLDKSIKAGGNLFEENGSTAQSVDWLDTKASSKELIAFAPEFQSGKLVKISIQTTQSAATSLDHLKLDLMLPDEFRLKPTIIASEQTVLTSRRRLEFVVATSGLIGAKDSTVLVLRKEAGVFVNVNYGERECATDAMKRHGAAMQNADEVIADNLTEDERNAKIRDLIEQFCAVVEERKRRQSLNETARAFFPLHKPTVTQRLIHPSISRPGEQIAGLHIRQFAFYNPALQSRDDRPPMRELACYVVEEVVPTETNIEDLGGVQLGEYIGDVVRINVGCDAEASGDVQRRRQCSNDEIPRLENSREPAKSRVLAEKKAVMSGQSKTVINRLRRRTERRSRSVGDKILESDVVRLIDVALDSDKERSMQSTGGLHKHSPLHDDGDKMVEDESPVVDLFMIFGAAKLFAIRISFWSSGYMHARWQTSCFRALAQKLNVRFVHANMQERKVGYDPPLMIGAIERDITAHPETASRAVLMVLRAVGYGRERKRERYVWTPDPRVASLTLSKARRVPVTARPHNNPSAIRTRVNNTEKPNTNEIRHPPLRGRAYFAESTSTSSSSIVIYPTTYPPDRYEVTARRSDF
ncbi:hypothetical protein R3P38DRAFT_2812052 [Favolaschia claudopus]|uniref:Uncharacterized protein n=1 Tax=Favolaschia claudopus TaxID=2862362 RepID=A0AAV9Z7G0_9AGAR